MPTSKRHNKSGEEMVTSPVTYMTSLYKLLHDAKITINRKYLESLGLEKAAQDLKKQVKQNRKENQTAGKKSMVNNVPAGSLVNSEDTAVMPPKHTKAKAKMCQCRNGNAQEEMDNGKTMP
ncbi:hypothetical protein ACA910_018640 [Epithemia clementina (nom. ined.)]